jgi:hypothetical protein
MLSTRMGRPVLISVSFVLDLSREYLFRRKVTCPITVAFAPPLWVALELPKSGVALQPSNIYNA